jgi:Lon protease-like protein
MSTSGGRIGPLPIFPLPSVQLFPHALLPLHVFEPRYRAMTAACLAGSRRMAVATLQPGFEANYEGRPPVVPVCGLGEIVAHHRHADGRYDLLLKGSARVRIVEELPSEEPYRLVRAEVLPDVYRSGSDLSIAHQSLVVLCDRLAGALPNGGDTLRQLARQEEDPAATVDLLAAALVTDPSARQELVEMLDVACRIDKVSHVVASVLGRLESSGGTGGAN